MNSENKSLDISAILIVEVLGKPPEHLTEALKDIVEKIGMMKGVEVSDSIFNPPIPLEKQPGFFTAFVEIEVCCESVSHLVSVMFNFMPAHVEILTPERITMSNNDWNDILNELGSKLHKYDGLAKMLQMEKKVLEDKIRAIMPKEVKEERTQKGI